MRWAPALLVLAALGVLAALRPGLLLAAAGSPRAWLVVLAVVVAGRFVGAGLHRLTGRPRLAGAGQLLLVGVVAVALVAPAFRQRTLVEDFPTPSAAAAAAADPAPSGAPVRRTVPAAPRLLSAGVLQGIRHEAAGRIALYAVDGGTVLRFEDVDVEGTPGPVVHLVPAGARTPDGGIRLGALAAERGSFGYPLPADLDVSAGWTLLVWCQPYDTGIAAADLSAA